MKWAVVIICLAASALAVSADTFTIETEYLFEDADIPSEVVVSRTNPTDAVNFMYSVIDREATDDDGDFPTQEDISAVIPAGSSTVTLTLTINDDGVIDKRESFNLQLKSFDDGSPTKTKRIFIVDSSDINLNCRDYRSLENNKKIEIVLRRNWEDRLRPLDVTVKAITGENYGPTALPKGYDSFDNEAESGGDFSEITQTITIPSGTLIKTIDVPVLDDVFDEQNEPFVITVTGDHIHDCVRMGIIVNDDAPKPFHCMRPGQDCQNSVECNSQTGNCPCGDGFTANDCSITDDPQPGCDGRCGRGGICRSDGIEPVITCHCKAGFAGEFCNNSAYDTQCNQNSFGICVTPYGNFDGSIYIEGSMDIPECNFYTVDRRQPSENPERIDGIQNWCDGYFLEMGYDGSVIDGKSCSSTTNAEGGVTEYIAHTIIQYGEGLNALDESFTSICRIDANGVILANDVVDVVADPSLLKKQVDEGEAEVIDFRLRIVGQGELGDTIYIDDKIQICANVETANAWNCVRIKQVKIDNDRSGGDFQEAIIFNEGCYPAEYRQTVYKYAGFGGTELVPDTEISCITILPFRFDSDFDLETFKMKIHVVADLPDLVGPCPEFTCGSRRKRQATGEEDFLYEFDVIARNRGEQVEASNTQSEVQEVANQTILPAIIGATVGGSLLVMSAIAVAFIVFRRRRKDPLDM